jgi:DNA mismatch repair ATPase MutS
MGKFYELFKIDAHVGAKELDLQYMKVSMICDYSRVVDFL